MMYIYACDACCSVQDCNISTFGLRTSPKALPMLHMVFMSRNNLQGSQFLDNLTDVAPFLTALDLTDNRCAALWGQRFKGDGWGR